MGGNGKGRRKAAPNPELAAALVSVKSLVTIVMGLALTNTIMTTLASGLERGPGVHEPLSNAHFTVESILCAAAIITAIVRFYHGNNQFLESMYGVDADPEKLNGGSIGIGVNFIVIMVQSVFFAVISFYVGGDTALIWIFGALLFLDILWWVANNTTVGRDLDAVKQQRAWMFNNLSFLALLVMLFSLRGHSWAVAAAAGVILANNLVDFRISWKFYFPSARPVEG